MDCGLVPREPGAYVVLLRVCRRVWLRRPRPALVGEGFYAYVGGARGPGGLRGRLCRHAGTASRRHWHVDQLLAEPCTLQAAVGLAPGAGEEELASRLAGLGLEAPVPGFGASDAAGERLYRAPGPRALLDGLPGLLWQLNPAPLQECPPC